MVSVLAEPPRWSSGRSMRAVETTPAALLNGDNRDILYYPVRVSSLHRAEHLERGLLSDGGSFDCVYHKPIRSSRPFAHSYHFRCPHRNTCLKNHVDTCSRVDSGWSYRRFTRHPGSPADRPAENDSAVT